MADVDKKRSNAYIWCCGATDITAKNLAEALGCKVGSEKPDLKKVAMVIGWGAKTKDAVNLGKIPVLNHPNSIRSNRNKFDALQTLQAAKVPVAAFVSAEQHGQIGKAGCKVALPVIGRKKFHQGGKGFWMCPTMTHVGAAVKEGAQYFQGMIEIADEYRLHVFEGELLYAAKKVARSKEEMEEAYVRQECDRLKSLAEKNNEAFDEEATKRMLVRQAKKHADTGPDMIIRSNRRGWKFALVKGPKRELVEAAGNAVKALGLNFGAVDCCIDVDGKVWILEVNTGPGLEETSFKSYVEAFKTAIDEILAPPKAAAAPQAAAKVTSKDKVVNKLVGKTGGGQAISSEARERLRQKLAMATDLVNNTQDDEEAAVLEKVINRMFTQGGQV